MKGWRQEKKEKHKGIWCKTGKEKEVKNDKEERKGRRKVNAENEKQGEHGREK